MQVPSTVYVTDGASFIADHLVRGWHHTHRVPTPTTDCSNNHSPYQFPEKLIPLMILDALDGQPPPVYGRRKYGLATGYGRVRLCLGRADDVGATMSTPSEDARR
jgi:hypothetical protein